MEADAVPSIAAITPSNGVYRLSVPGAGEDTAKTGNLDITGDLIIEGAVETATIVDGGGLERVFRTLGGSTVNISGLTALNSSGGAPATSCFRS